MKRVTKLPKAEKRVMMCLLATDWRNGAEVVGRGVPPGTAYVTLDRMERKGLVESERRPRNDSNGGVALRFFRITPLGRTTLKLQPHIKTVKHFVMPGEAMAEIEEGGCSMCGEPVPLPVAYVSLALDDGVMPPVQCTYCKRFLVRTMK